MDFAIESILRDLLRDVRDDLLPEVTRLVKAHADLAEKRRDSS